MTKPPKPFRVTTNGTDARQYVFKSKSPKKIALSMALEYQLARQWFGLSAAEFDLLPGNPEWANGSLSKADVLAAYRMYRLMDAISQDVSIKRHK